MDSVPSPRHRDRASRLGRAIAVTVSLISVLTLTSEAAMARTIRLVALGDSLTAGYRLNKSEAFPAVLEAELKKKGWDVKIANAGVSGDTAAQGAARVDWSVPDGTDGVILELGANDALRGLDPAATKGSLSKILDRLRSRKIPVLIAGMFAPRSLGSAYYQQFDAIYPALAKTYGADLYPFFLEGVVGNRALNLDDGVHPSAEGVRRIVAGILPAAERFLRRIQPAS